MSKNKIQVALISMPWAIFNRPSIQLGALKAFLETSSAEIKVINFHPYLESAALLGPETYHAVSLDPWLCEAFFAPMIFPAMRVKATKFGAARLKRLKKPNLQFDPLRAGLEDTLSRFVDSIDWSEFDLVGFSVCFNQLAASLAAAKLIKQKSSATAIVLGGSQMVVGSNNGWLKHFEFIDQIIHGEGEKPLLQLCERLKQSWPAGTSSPGGGQVKDLNELPLPDYGDYFSQKDLFFPNSAFIPVLPVEFSRGCWWGKCSFCNLNMQWCGYRNKTGERFYEEVTALAGRYASLDFSLTDNVLPVKDSKIFFEKVRDSGQDLDFFGEVRADQRRLFQLYRQGGLSTIQAGIEGLSDSLLNRFQKGTRVIDNLAVMKTAQVCGLQLEGNLITCFPFSSEQEVEETLANLDFAWSYQALKTAAFFLGHGSPVAGNPQKYGIRPRNHHANYANFLPPEVLGDLTLPVLGYRGGRLHQKKMWAPVDNKVKLWAEFHAQRRARGEIRPPLSFRDGGSFLIIRQERANGPTLHHRLKGLSRRIYLACDDIRELADLSAEFSEINEEKLLAFIDDMVKKRLMFRDEKKVLALAVRPPKYQGSDNV